MNEILWVIFCGILIGIGIGYHLYRLLWGIHDERKIGNLCAELKSVEDKYRAVCEISSSLMEINTELVQELKKAEDREDSADWWKKL